MKTPISFILIFLFFFSAAKPSDIRVLVITGGHDYNQREFAGMLDSLPGKITYRIVEFPGAFTMLEKQYRNEYDLILFYHMWQNISVKQQNDLSECIREGKPLVVLHHSICAFDDWNEYVNLIGGKYFHRPDTIEGRILQPSSYQHDIPVNILIKDKSHPVTAGLEDFTMIDETYNGFYVQPGVTSLLTTDTPGSTDIIGWTKNYGRSRVVVLQSGHDVPSFRNPSFRRLLWQAINWAAGRSDE